MSKRNENRPGYKETKAEWIPEDWQDSKLGLLGSFTNGINKDKEDFGFGSPILNLQDVFGRNEAKDFPNGLVNSTIAEKKRYGLKRGDVIFVRSSVKPEGVGLTSIVQRDLPDTVFSGFLIRFRQKNKIFDNNYLRYCFFQFGFRKELLRRSTVSANTNINQVALSSLIISIPPLPEQRKIAEILNTWDNAIELVDRQIDAAKQLKMGLMQQLLTGRTRFPGFNRGWREMQLGQFLKTKLRKVEKPKDAYLRLGVRSHGRGTFTTIVEDPSTVDMTHLYQIREGDLIVSITFAWEGAIAMVEADGNGAYVSHRFPTFLFDSKKVVPEFFRYLMHTPQFFYDLGVVSPGGAGRNRVMSKRNFLKIKGKVPSVEEQRKIGGLLTSLDSDITNFQSCWKN